VLKTKFAYTKRMRTDFFFWRFSRRKGGVIGSGEGETHFSQICSWILIRIWLAWARNLIAFSPVRKWRGLRGIDRSLWIMNKKDASLWMGWNNCLYNVSRSEGGNSTNPQINTLYFAYSSDSGWSSKLLGILTVCAKCFSIPSRNYKR